ncbi:hypothetical protein ACU4GR_17730 [Methylobacterium oryzae CBMB20]
MPERRPLPVASGACAEGRRAASAGSALRARGARRRRSCAGSSCSLSALVWLAVLALSVRHIAR